MIEKIIHNRKVLLVCAISTIIAFSYSYIVSGDPRLLDGNIASGKYHWWEVVLLVLGLMSAFLVWGSSMNDALKNNRYKWFFLTLLIWPLSYLYAILINTKFIEE